MNGRGAIHYSLKFDLIFLNFQLVCQPGLQHIALYSTVYITILSIANSPLTKYPLLATDHQRVTVSLL